MYERNTAYCAAAETLSMPIESLADYFIAELIRVAAAPDDDWVSANPLVRNDTILVEPLRDAQVTLAALHAMYQYDWNIPPYYPVDMVLHGARDNHTPDCPMCIYYRRPQYRRRPLGEQVARLLLFERDGGKCRHCGSTENLTVDHVVPVVLGGTNAIDNLQTLCGSCNSRKGARV